MTLREEFENEVKNNKGGISVLFETSNQHYIDWLENKVKALSQHDVSGRSEQLSCDKCKFNCKTWDDNHPCASCCDFDNYQVT